MQQRTGYNLYRLLAAAWRHRYALLLPALVLPMFGIVISATSPHLYQTHMSFLIQETARMNPFLEDLSVSSQIKERMSALQTLLHSRHILLGVIDELKLAGEQPSEAVKERKLNELSAALSVQLIGSDLIKLSYHSTRNQDMALLLDTVSQRFIEQLLAPEQSSLQASETFLAQQLEQRRQALRISQQKLEQFKTDNAQLLPELHASTVAQLRQTQMALAEKQVQLSGAQARFNTLQQQLNQTNPVLGKMELTLVDLMSELTLLRTRYTENHSQVQSLLHQIAQLQQKRQELLQNPTELDPQDTQRLWQLASNLQSSPEQQPLLISQLNLLQVAQSEVEQLHHETNRLQQRSMSLQQQVDAHGKIEHTLNTLQHDIQTQSRLYDDLLNRYQMANVTNALGRFEAPERIKIIDPAFTPRMPSNLPLWMYIIGGIIGGLSLGIAIAAAREMTDSSIRYATQLTELAGVHVITELPPIHCSAVQPL